MKTALNIGFEETARFVASRLGAGPMKILDAGCGRGGLSAKLKAMGHDVTSVDLSEESRQLAEEYGVDVIVADFMRFSAAKEFDAVIFSRSVHHAHPIEVAMERAFSLLKNGGMLILEEFSVDRMDEVTASWFYQTDSLLTSLGILTDNQEGKDPRQETYVDRWKTEHDYEPPFEHIGYDAFDGPEIFQDSVRGQGSVFISLLFGSNSVDKRGFYCKRPIAYGN